ncbi:MAG: phosphotransferase [Dokdonella sp.]|uniref:aminoglycoside phosphotransferase family protein n=1 Tax=Dokdonella sp. TaxID=2291710 RepID=UPI003267AA05
MASTTGRTEALRRFAESALSDTDLAITVASADASFRSYWRVTGAHGTRIVMDAPPDKEELDPWLDVGARLRAAGLHTPYVFATDAARGFVLMEDLGVRTYLPELDTQSADRLYGDALEALLWMQTRVDTRGLQLFSRTHLVAEMALMPPWFLQRHLGIVLRPDQLAVIDRAFEFIAASARDQPHVFMHRDYHSRNLLVIDTDTSGIQTPSLRNPGIIDFQGAFVGPITYDLASLLRDCYIEWDGTRVDTWMESHRLRLRDERTIDRDVDLMRFRRWFDLTGLQRHIKVLGIFCRLWYRDGKVQYLADLPLVRRYVVGVASRYPELAAFVALLERARANRDLTVSRPESGA